MAKGALLSHPWRSRRTRSSTIRSLRLQPEELGVTPGAFAAAFASRLDHKKKLEGYEGPLLLMHAVHDGLVPLDNAERLASWARGPVSTRLFQHGDHNSVLYENRADYLDAVSEFLSNVLP